MIRFILLLICSICCACSSELEDTQRETGKDADEDGAFYVEYRLNDFEIDQSSFQFDSSAVILNDLEEASGIIESRLKPNYFYKHNDSGSDARLYLYAANGNQAGQFKLEGITAIDYEDIAINTEEGKDYIYLGDFGDNKEKRKTVSIYRFQEPKFTVAQEYFRDTVNTIDQIEYQYLDKDFEEAVSYNCEALFVDPISRNIYVITKGKSIAHLYKITYPYSFNKINDAHLCGSFTIPPNQITAADISADGKEILIKTYEHVLYWRRDLSQSVEEILQTSFIRVPYLGEPQGEAICFISNGGYVTVSEQNPSVKTKFNFYKPK
ncbi:hypothetical protein [Labilibacter marinus]|uniref:hypothetical protein n=1 Tax=Labilibacter marinus TaxID=1477105 RepID=UPI00082FCF6B|nr:hypothetical protein [Labilibacter marinus]